MKYLAACGFSLLFALSACGDTSPPGNGGIQINMTGAYQQQYQNLAMWVALCGDGKNYAVFIAPTDDIQVRDCTEHAQLNLPLCRRVPPMPHDPQTPPSAEPDLNLINAANANLAG